MKKITRKFKQLPPEAGVHFAGVKNIGIESRQSVIREIRDFVRYCNKEAIAPAARVILGEWGEGKTEAYHKYVQQQNEKGNYAYLVSASSVAHAFDRFKSMSFVSSVIFLAAVFLAIKEETKAESIPHLSNFNNLETWLQEVLSTHHNPARERGNIYVFIDEFEELILEPELLKRILSGLKEVINGQFKPVAEGGEYDGSLFFFLACTPDAYNRMRADPEIDQVFGSYDRRIDKINIEPIRSQEAVRFLFDLLKYSYQDNLPEQLPFTSAGILYNLYSIGRGNLGALVSCFTKLLNSSVTDNETIQIVDHEYFLNYFSEEYISIYGGSSRCIEREILTQVERKLRSLEQGETYISLFRLLVGELQPFSAAEIVASLGLKFESLVLKLIEGLDEQLNQLGYTNSILQLVKFKDDISFQDILACLEEYVVAHKLTIDGFSAEVEQFEDSLTHLTFNSNGDLESKFFFPSIVRHIQALFRGISMEKAEELQHRLSQLLEPQTIYYRVSSELTLQIYPAPVPPGLEFIKDRNLRMTLWRKVTTQFFDLYRKTTPQAFTTLLSQTEKAGIHAMNRQATAHGMRVVLLDREKNYTISAYVSAVPGDISRKDLEVIQQDINNLSEVVHLLILLHSGGKIDEALRMLSPGKTGPQPLLFYIHPTYAKLLMATFIANIEHSDMTVQKLLQDALTNLFERELEVQKKIEGWLNDAQEAGLVIQDLHRDYATGDKQLADVLKFYINCVGEDSTPAQVFDYNTKELFKMIPYGTKSGLAPDIETLQQFERLTGDLLRNGFLKAASEESMFIQTTPVEARLLHLLEENSSLSKRRLPDYFVTLAKAKTLLNDVYLAVLHHKGLIEIKKTVVQYKPNAKIIQEVKARYEKYRKELDVERREPHFADYGHIYVAKEREAKIIWIDEFDQLVCELYDKINQFAHQDNHLVVSSQCRVLELLLDNFEAHLLPKIQLARKLCNELVDGAQEAFEETQIQLNSIIAECERWLDSRLPPELIQEYAALIDAKTHFFQAGNTVLGKEQLGELASQIDQSLFHFRNLDSEEHPFNLKYVHLKKAKGGFDGCIEKCARFFERFEELFSLLEQKLNEQSRQVLTLRVKDDYQLAPTLLEHLRSHLQNFNRRIDENELTSEIDVEVSLQELYNAVLRRKLEIFDQFNQIERLCGVVLNLAEDEQAYMKEKCVAEDKLQICQTCYDTEEYASYVQDAAVDVDKLNQRYDMLKAEMQKLLSEWSIPQKSEFAHFERSLRDSVRDYQDICEYLVEAWQEFCKQTRSFVEKTLATLSVLKRVRNGVEASEVEAMCQSLIDKDDFEVFISSGDKISELEIKKAQIRELMFDEITKELEQEEASVFDAIVQQLSSERESWLSLSKIHQAIELLNPDENQALQIIEALVLKGYLVKGICLPM